MSTTLELCKLAELRVKTDQELVRIINDQLERGLRLTLIAEGKSSTRTFHSTEPLHAEKAYAEGMKLLPMVEDPSERRRLERKQLREALDRPSAPDESWAQAAYSSG